MSGRTSGAPDRVTIHPAPLDGAVDVAGDKSIGHRSLLIGSLAVGPVEVSGLSTSADIAATAEALRRLGVRVELEPEGHGLLGGVLEGPIVRAADAPIRRSTSATSRRTTSGSAAISGVGECVMSVWSRRAAGHASTSAIVLQRAGVVSLESSSRSRRPSLVMTTVSPTAAATVSMAS